MIESKHIHSAFDDELENIHTLIMTMGGKVEQAIQQSSIALRTRDTEISEQVVKSDAEIDKLEEDINAEAVSMLARRQPQAQDLRTILAIMKISSNLERVGDYAKNIAKRNFVLVQSPPLGSSSGSLKRLSKSVEQLTKDSLDAFIRRDVDKATHVLLRDEDIDQMCNALFREFLAHMMEDPRSITPIMHYLFIAKNLERIGDYATGIAEQVVFLVTGSLPESDRPKDGRIPHHDDEPNEISIGEKG